MLLGTVNITEFSPTSSTPEMEKFTRNTNMCPAAYPPVFNVGTVQTFVPLSTPPTSFVLKSPMCTSLTVVLRSTERREGSSVFSSSAFTVGAKFTL